MKKFTAIFSAVIMLIVLSIPSFAEITDIKTNIASAKKYLETNATEAVTFEDTISFAEAGLVTDIMKIYSVKPDENDALSLSEYILLKRTFGGSVKISEDSAEDYGDKLISLQKEDGSFGDVKTTIYAIGSLLSLGKTPDKKAAKPYDDAAAVNFIISKQSENGEIENLETSVYAAAILKHYESSEAAENALNKLENYLNSLSKSDDITVLSLSLMGLTDINYGTVTETIEEIINKIISFQNDDGGFSQIKGENSEIEATKIAFRALESVRYTVTPFNALINKVQFKTSGIDFSTIMPMLILYGVMVIFSIGLWIFIFKRKPRSGTLEDSKKFSAEKLKNVQKLTKESDEDNSEK